MNNWKRNRDNSKKKYVDKPTDKSAIVIVDVIILLVSVAAFAVFLVITGFITNKLLMITLALVLAYPIGRYSYSEARTSKSKIIIKYYIASLLVVFFMWLSVALGTTLIPFVFSIMIAYTLEPVVSRLERWRLPRWFSALFAVLVASGIVVATAVFVFPLIIEQMQSIINSAGEYASSIQKYIGGGKFYELLESLGFPQDAIISTITKELLPRTEMLVSTLFDSLLRIFLSFSSLTTHILNLIILPFLTFYFLKDFGKLKKKIGFLLKKENKKIYYYLQRFDNILKTYIAWQISAACIVFVLSSISFSLFGLPYAILIAAIAGLLNPLPYFGTIFSLIVGSSVILLVNDVGVVSQILVLFGTIMGVHFINAYLLEPNIAGQKVGLHPILMILSVFIFHALFGVFGMLVAVPIMSVFMLVIQETLKEHFDKIAYKKVEKNNMNL